jgi:integrase
MIGLLAATGMRVGETIALDRDDFDWSDDGAGAGGGLQPLRPVFVA